MVWRFSGREFFVVWGSLWVVIGSGFPVQEAVAAHGLRPEEVSEGWLELFDGESLFGWRSVPEGAWQVAQGVLQCHLGQTAKADEPVQAVRVAQQKPSTPSEKTLPSQQSGQSAESGRGVPSPVQPARLITTTEWADFQLRMDFRADPHSQASLLLRTPPELKTSPSEGYEVVLASEDSAAWPTGSLKGRQKAKPVPLPEGWHSLQVALEGGLMRVWVDGHEVLGWEESRAIRRGHLVLEVRTGSAEFRNIKLRPLGLRSIFNGKDLSGWKEYPGMPTKCTVTPEGYLRLQGGRGQLESEGQYADFTFQLEVFVNGQGLNSGVFFRCIPGETMNGYECQIHNGFLDGDRRKPKDCGTGGIFRRQNARRVVADDFQWFTLTIHAHGPHVATWVNGYQTADWTDTRPPDPNPRKGRRLEAGTL